jgi:transcriptional regulator with XRE-family HTH domain
MVTTESFPERVARRFGGLRRDRSWPLADLAQRSGLHRTSLGLVERGDRRLTLESAKRLADALEVPLWQVVRSAEEEAEDEASGRPDVTS